MRVPRWLIAGVLVLWGVVGFSIEGYRAARGREASPHLYPASWLLGGPQVEPLRRGLAELDLRLPAGALVAIDSKAWDPGQLHYLTMWAAYYLPRHQVIHREYGELVGRPLYWLTIPPLPNPPAGAESPPWSATAETDEPAPSAPFSVHRYPEMVADADGADASASPR